MTRRTATFVWAALLVVPFVFLLVSRGTSPLGEPGAVEPLFWAAIAASALNVALSRVLPPRLGPAHARNRDAVAFARMLVSLALGEAAVMAPIVAYALTRDLRLVAVAAADALALALLFPTDRRWDALAPAPGGAPAPGRTVR